MHAAVVRSFDRPPTYEGFPTPEPDGEDDFLVDVLAAGLHPRVRSGANNSHYTSGGELPMVPGVDAVGRHADGRLLYFVANDGPVGTMADVAVVDRRRCVELPAGLAPVVAAAAMNPAMSSWIALRRRIAFQPGQHVLILGATGNAGQLAVQIAKRLGAGTVIAAGRDADRLESLMSLGADALISLTGEPADIAERYAAAADVDVVLDYVWGAPAEAAMEAVLTQRRDRSRPLAWIQIGATAGPTLALPSAFLRGANIRVLGSGQGSVATKDYLAEFPPLLEALADGTLEVNARAVPLAEVEATWSSPTDPDHRIVFVP